MSKMVHSVADKSTVQNIITMEAKTKKGPSCQLKDRSIATPTVTYRALVVNLVHSNRGSQPLATHIRKLRAKGQTLLQWRLGHFRGTFQIVIARLTSCHQENLQSQDLAYSGSCWNAYYRFHISECQRLTFWILNRWYELVLRVATYFELGEEVGI